MKNKKQLPKIIMGIIFVICIACIFIFRDYYKFDDRIEILENYNKIESKPKGWIQVQGTNIDMPIVYYSNVSDLTDPSFDFGWTYEDGKSLQNRTVIMSHNVLNVSSKPLIGNKEHRRFEQLMAYIYYDFVKENKYIQYTIDKKNYIFKIYAVSFQKQELVDLKNIKNKDKNTYIKYTKNMSYFDFDTDINKNDKLITLVTCTRFFGDSDYSFVVDGRLLRENELMKNYKVTKKSNYKKIEKRLKGDDSNE